MLTKLSMIASIVPWGLITLPLGTTAQAVGLTVQICGLLALVVIISSGRWMEV